MHCTVNFEWRKVKMCQFGSAKWFWPNILTLLYNKGRLERRRWTGHPTSSECTIHWMPIVFLWYLVGTHQIPTRYHKGNNKEIDSEPFFLKKEMHAYTAFSFPLSKSPLAYYATTLNETSKVCTYFWMKYSLQVAWWVLDQCCTGMYFFTY